MRAFAKVPRASLTGRKRNKNSQLQLTNLHTVANRKGGQACDKHESVTGMKSSERYDRAGCIWVRDNILVDNHNVMGQGFRSGAKLSNTQSSVTMPAVVWAITGVSIQAAGLPVWAYSWLGAVAAGKKKPHGFSFLQFIQLLFVPLIVLADPVFDAVRADHESSTVCLMLEPAAILNT